MKLRIFALTFALAAMGWAQTATPATPTAPAEKAKSSCCDKMDTAGSKDGHTACMRDGQKGANGKEIASCCAGKEEISCCGGKDTKSCMKDDKTAASCGKECAGKDKSAACCDRKAGKECGKGCCGSNKSEKPA